MSLVAAQAEDKWKWVGLQLDIPAPTLNSLEIEKKDPKDRYLSIFSEWRKSLSPPYTWETIIEALQSPCVGRQDLASSLRDALTR